MILFPRIRNPRREEAKLLHCLSDYPIEEINVPLCAPEGRGRAASPLSDRTLRPISARVTSGRCLRGSIFRVESRK